MEYTQQTMVVTVVCAGKSFHVQKAVGMITNFPAWHVKHMQRLEQAKVLYCSARSDERHKADKTFEQA